MDRLLSIIAGFFLIAFFCFLWGWASSVYKFFPYEFIHSTTNEISGFFKGGEGDQNLTTLEKLENDRGGTPYRQLVARKPAKFYNGCDRLSGRFSVDQKTCELFLSKEIIGNNFKPGYLSFGPYVNLTAGDYEVTFLLSINAPRSATVGFLDGAHTENSTPEVFYKKTLHGTEGRSEPLSFQVTLPEDMNRVEFRVNIQTPTVARIKSLAIKKRPAWEKRSYFPVEFAKKNPRRANPEIYKKNKTLFDDGLLFIFGAIDSNQSLQGGFILNKYGDIIHTVNISDETTLKKAEKLTAKGETYKYIPMEIRFPHGVEILQDGSIIFNDGDSGNSIRRIDWCGKETWSRLVRSHHSLTVRGNLAWHLETSHIEATNIATGELEKAIKLTDIVLANQKEGGLDIRKNIMANKYFEDAFHWNDVDPLPAELSQNFKQFSPGDLLLSSRSLDLIAVMDPETLKFKWWRIGATKRQHDPDWQPGGKITIFDNQMGNEVSRIVSIDPATFASEVLYSGEKDDAYTWMRGKHQILPDKSILMTFPQQGRVLLAEPDGTTRFDFFNKYNDKQNLLVSEAIYLPPDYFNPGVLDKTCN